MIQTALKVWCVLIFLSLPTYAQEEPDKWQRVYTGDDSVIDMNISSVTFDPGHILRVMFRTTLSKSENLKDHPEIRYRSRLETFEFKLSEKQYRLREVSLLDPTGKSVQSYTANAEDWKVRKDGGMMQKLFEAVRHVPPFGEWKVVDYRLGETSRNDGREFRRLLGTRVRLDSESAAVGIKICSSPAYRSELMTDVEFLRQLGIPMSSIGIQATHARTVIVKCEENGWAPPQSLLVKVPEGQLMLWQGIFLVLKKDH